MNVPHSRASGPPLARPRSSPMEQSSPVADAPEDVCSKRVLLLVGTGLIGGSFALASRANRLFDRIVGIDSNPEALETARALGIVEGPEQAFEPTAICIATPVSRIATCVADAASRYPGVPIFDVGSVKATVVDTLRASGEVPANFVPCHPIAGSETVGASAARADLFQGRSVIITPVDETDPDTVSSVESWWRGVGASVTMARPHSHDRLVAATSHLPHLVAFALMEVLDDIDDRDLSAYIGDGFLDLSRVAASDPTIWSDILQENRDATLRLGRQLAARLAIDEDKPALKQRIARARNMRLDLDGSLD